jgi:hypothetical protein
MGNKRYFKKFKEPKEPKIAHQDEISPSYSVLSPWLEVQQTFWQRYCDWLSWQQFVAQEGTKDNLRGLEHTLQLTSQPLTLYRYLRLNWQKPYLHFGSHALTSSRLLSRAFTDSWATWQRTVENSRKPH